MAWRRQILLLLLLLLLLLNLLLLLKLLRPIHLALIIIHLPSVIPSTPIPILTNFLCNSNSRILLPPSSSHALINSPRHESNNQKPADASANTDSNLCAVAETRVFGFG